MHEVAKVEKKIDLFKPALGQETLESLWIENAAYFLKEHMIYFSHLVTFEKIYIRLIGEKFSVNKYNLKKFFF